MCGKMVENCIIERKKMSKQTDELIANALIAELKTWIMWTEKTSTENDSYKQGFKAGINRAVKEIKNLLIDEDVCD